MVGQVRVPGEHAAGREDGFDGGFFGAAEHPETARRVNQSPRRASTSAEVPGGGPTTQAVHVSG